MTFGEHEVDGNNVTEEYVPNDSNYSYNSMDFDNGEEVIIYANEDDNISINEATANWVLELK